MSPSNFQTVAVAPSPMISTARFPAFVAAFSDTAARPGAPQRNAPLA